MTTEYKQALESLFQARQDFENAEPEYVEVATYKLKAAEEQLSTVIKQMKIKGEEKI